jgi:hypothetical protein
VVVVVVGGSVVVVVVGGSVVVVVVVVVVLVAVLFVVAAQLTVSEFFWTFVFVRAFTHVTLRLLPALIENVFELFDAASALETVKIEAPRTKPANPVMTGLSRSLLTSTPPSESRWWWRESGLPSPRPCGRPSGTGELCA